MNEVINIKRPNIIKEDTNVPINFHRYWRIYTYRWTKKTFKKLVDIGEEQLKKILECPIDDILQKIRNEKVTIYQQK